MFEYHHPPHNLLRLGNIHDVELAPPPPVMKSFKEFLLSLDDSVDETEAVKRYNEYKMDFRRQQMQDFFLAHKDEEWYGPAGRPKLCMMGWAVPSGSRGVPCRVR